MLLWNTIKLKNLQICSDHAYLAYIFVKRSVHQKELVTEIFFRNHNYQGGIGKFIYEASILDNKQPLSYLIDHKATQVPHTTSIAFLTDNYVYILLKLPNHSLQYCYMMAAL